jgi:hypothetical protein
MVRQAVSEKERHEIAATWVTVKHADSSGSHWQPGVALHCTPSVHVLHTPLPHKSLTQMQSPEGLGHSDEVVARLQFAVVH